MKNSEDILRYVKFLESGKNGKFFNPRNEKIETEIVYFKDYIGFGEVECGHKLEKLVQSLFDRIPDRILSIYLVDGGYIADNQLNEKFKLVAIPAE